MFVSTRDQGAPRRRSRSSPSYSINTAAQSSKLSLLSGFTAMSSGSGGSASTVTQETYSRPRKHHSTNKRRIKKRRMRGSKTAEDATTDTAIADTELKEKGKGKAIDVFEFLVEDKVKPGTEDLIRLSSLPEVRPPTPQPEIATQEPDSDPECFYRSHFSDSGISSGSSSGEPAYLEAHAKHPLPPLIEESSERGAPHTYAMSDSVYPQYEAHTTWTHSANGAYPVGPPPLSPISSRSVFVAPEYRPEIPNTPSTADSFSTCLGATPLVFKEKGVQSAPKLSIVRSFSKVNSKLLLQMQINIAELEHELTLLDNKSVSAETSKHKKSEGLKPSRHAMKDQARRADLYQELHISLDQYYQALSATHQINQMLTPCRSNEIIGFKEWLGSHISPSHRVQTLAGDSTDLVCLSAKTGDVGVPIDLRFIAFSILVNVFIPLALFKLISSVLSRLMLLSLVTAAGAIVLDRAEIKLDKVHQQCIIVLTSISLGAALLL